MIKSARPKEVHHDSATVMVAVGVVPHGGPSWAPELFCRKDSIMKKIPAYETSDGRVFTGNDAHKKAKVHEECITKRTMYLRMERAMMAVLGIGTDDEAAQDEFSEMMDLVVSMGNFEDSFNLIVNIIAMIGDKLPELVSLFNNHGGMKLLGNKSDMDATEYKWDSAQATYVGI